MFRQAKQASTVSKADLKAYGDEIVAALKAISFIERPEFEALLFEVRKLQTDINVLALSVLALNAKSEDGE